MKFAEIKKDDCKTHWKMRGRVSGRVYLVWGDECYCLRKWQNSKHSSRNAWVQVLKDLMRNHSADDPGLDAETDQLGGSGDDGNSSEDDPIPENFFGIPDRPAYTSKSTSSEPAPESEVEDPRDHHVRV